MNNNQIKQLCLEIITIRIVPVFVEGTLKKFLWDDKELEKLW